MSFDKSKRTVLVQFRPGLRLEGLAHDAHVLPGPRGPMVVARDAEGVVSRIVEFCDDQPVEYEFASPSD